MLLNFIHGHKYFPNVIVVNITITIIIVETHWTENVEVDEGVIALIVNAFNRF